jgi:hypothetical protein
VTGRGQVSGGKPARRKIDKVREATTARDEFFALRVVGGISAAALAVLSAVSANVSDATLVLAGIAIFIVAFPWQRLAALKAGPFEFSLEPAQVKGMVDSVAGAAAKHVEAADGDRARAAGVAGSQKEKLPALLSQLDSDIKRARGSRVLWVDDRPTRVVAERRLFRALGVETVVVSSCRDAGLLLMRDNDFDLVITSLEKGTEQKKRADVKDEKNFAILLIEWLRGEAGSGIEELMGDGVTVPVKDPVVENVAVIVYAGFPPPYIREKIRSLAGLEPPVEASASPDDLLKKAIRALADQRSTPIETPAKKATS